MDGLVSSEEIILKSEELSLYNNLIQQINKDFNRANIAVEIPLESSPNELIILLNEIITKLINQQFSDYLNLLYIMDVSEATIKQKIQNNPDQQISDHVYVILLREWQKVWFKANY